LDTLLSTKISIHVAASSTDVIHIRSQCRLILAPTIRGNIRTASTRQQDRRIKTSSQGPKLVPAPAAHASYRQISSDRATICGRARTENSRKISSLWRPPACSDCDSGASGAAASGSTSSLPWSGAWPLEPALSATHGPPHVRGLSAAPGPDLAV
jgi:hypothetical protein